MASGNDKEVKIGITAETSGADEAKRALEGVKKAGEEIGKGTGAAGKEAAEGLKEVEEAAKKAENAEKRTVEGIKQVTEATKELTEAEADRARRKAEFEARLAAKRADGTDASVPAVDMGNPMAMPDHIKERDAERLAEREAQIRAFNEAERARGKALEETAKAEAEAIEQRKKNAKATEDAATETKKLNEQSKELRTMLLGQGLTQAGEVFGKMAAGLENASRELKDVNPELADTAEKGAKVAGALSSVTGAAATGMLTMGPWGAVIGATTALVGELGAAWIDSMADAEKAAEAAGKKAEDGAKRLGELVTEMHDANAEAEKGSFKRWAEDMEQGADAMARQNDELERNLSLSREKQVAEAALDRAQTEKKIGEVMASDLSDKDKTAQVAGLREGLAQRESGRKIAGFNDDVATEQERLKIANEEVKRKTEDTRIAEEKLKAEQEKQRKIDQAKSQLNYHGGENGYVAEAEARLARAEKGEEEINTFMYGLNTGVKNLFTDYDSNADRSARREERARAQEDLDKILSKTHALRETAKGASSAEDAQKKLEDAQAKQKAAEEAYARQYTTVEDSKKHRDVRVQTEGKIYEIGRDTRGTATSHRLDEIEERRLNDELAARIKQQDAAKKRGMEEAREGERDEDRRIGIGKQLSGLVETGADIAAKKPQTSGGVAKLEALSDMLRDGASAAELAEMNRLLDLLINAVGAQSKDGRDVHDLKVKMSELEGQLKKIGDRS